MGSQTWVAITIIITEVLIVFKFDWETVTKPFPRHIAISWTIFLTGLFLWTVWQFWIKPFLNWEENRQVKNEKNAENKDKKAD